MKVLVIGGGGREHTLVWKIKQSKKVSSIYCAPGNAGIAEIAECVDIKAEDINSLLRFAKEHHINLTVVGPEAPLVAGVVDEFKKEGLRVFGPDKRAAQIEGSKVWAKNILNKYQIPTGKAEIFDNPKVAVGYATRQKMPLVIKADGLAAGKGVIIANNEEEIRKAIDLIMVKESFGEAGKRVIIEEYLEGEEFSFIALTDGRDLLPLALAQDYKKVYDGDKGPNTGGMGCYSPVPLVSPQTYNLSWDKILKKIIYALFREGVKYQGVIYAGLIQTKDGPKVLEFNCRFGDPENQVIIPRLESDLIEIMEAVIEERLGKIKIVWSDKVALCVVLSSGDYPGSYEKGKIITGLKDAQILEGVILFQAGSAKKNGKVVTSGGRVLGVTALGSNFEEAIGKAYQAVEKIHFEGMHYRKDIGLRVKSLGVKRV